ncbi:MAG: sigma-70 family RNA polymerase sigma factor, partial [Bacteroidetes bacterium]|nr:sigma-70 family RNA polymerase sigma factor [Bacteroidota bacterium]
MDTQSPEADWRRWFEEQFARHAALVRAVIWNRLGRIHGGSLIEELASETWVRAVRGVQKPSFDPHRDFAPWICAIAVNVCREQVRRFNGKGTTALVEPDELPDPVDFKQAQELLELHRAIENCIGRLDEADQNVYRLRFEQGLSGRATADS